MSTLKGELLPFVVKKQLSKHSVNKNLDEMHLVDDIKPDIFSMSRESDIEYNIRSMSSFGDSADSGEIIKCYACVLDSYVGIRANILHDYCKINKIVCAKFMKAKKVCMLFI